MTLESSLPIFSFLSENFSSPNFSAAVCVCGASAREAMLSFEGSCIAALALYGALSLLVKLFWRCWNGEEPFGTEEDDGR